MDGLARGGAIFTHAVAVAPTTLPSHASILTGLYPHRHGARANSAFDLDEGRSTLAETLRSAGYATAAFTSAFVLDSRFRLDQGFDVYDDETPVREDWVIAHRPGDATTDRALEWLAQPRDRPFFAWVHYYDPHAPYQPPDPYAKGVELAYDGEIAFVDDQLGRLLQLLEEHGRKTIVVVVADHGEALGEQGESTHGFLVSEATVRVPLLVHAPGVVAAGTRVDAWVSQVDLVPTVLSLLGVPAPLALDGVDLTRPIEEREVYTESLQGRIQFGWRRTSALYDESLKYVEGAMPQLYDLAADPRETVDLANARPADVKRLERRAEEIRESGGEFVAPRGFLTLEEQSKLEALGYVVSKTAAVRAGGSGLDPREGLPLLERVQRSLLCIRSRGPGGFGSQPGREASMR
jgi:arylsulfatase A-like enzyme